MTKSWINQLMEVYDTAAQLIWFQLTNTACDLFINIIIMGGKLQKLEIEQKDINN